VFFFFFLVFEGPSDFPILYIYIQLWEHYYCVFGTCLLIVRLLFFVIRLSKMIKQFGFIIG